MTLFANLPAPTVALAGTELTTTDQGVCYCNGSQWVVIGFPTGNGSISLSSPGNTIAIAGSPGNTITEDVVPALLGGQGLVPGIFTFATLPTASSSRNMYARTSDVGAVYSNGSVWQPLFNVTNGSLAIANNPPLISGSNGTAYSLQLSATGGAPPYTWLKVSQFADTNAWTVSSTGVLACASPATATQDNIDVQVTDSTGATTQKLLTVAIAASAGTPAATPTFSPAAGSYITTQTVTISDASAGTTIYYTTNGSTPTTSSPVYSSPITVSSSQTISAIAVGGSFTQSPIGSASYIITITPVAWNPPSPRIWSVRFPNGGQTYQYTPFLNWSKSNALTGIGVNYTGSAVAQFGGTGRGQYVDTMHSSTLVPGGCKVVQYIDPFQYDGTNPTPPAGGDTVHGVFYPHVDTNNWLLRVTGTSGSCPTNGSFYVPNISTYAPADSAGDKLGAFSAKWWNQCFKQGSGPYQSGFAAADAAPNIDGPYGDDFWYTGGRVGGSIARDGTTDSPSVATNTGSSADVRANNWRAGCASFFNQITTDFPGALRVANADYAGHLQQYGTPTNDPTIVGAMNQVLDCPEAQFFFGWGFTEGGISFANMVKLYQLYTNMCRPGVAAPLLDIAFLSGVGTTAFGATGNGIPGCCPLTWTSDQPASYSAAYIGARYYPAFTNIVGNGMIGCDGFTAAVNQSLQTFDEWGNFGSPGFAPGFAGNLLHGNTDPIQTTAKYGNGIWERRVFNSTTGTYGRWVMNPRGNGPQTYNPGVTLYKGVGTQNPSYNNGASFTTLAMSDPDGGFFFESPQSGGGPSQSVLQFLSANDGTSASSTSQAMSTVTAGSTILVLTETNFASVSSITDTLGNSYAAVQTAQSTAGPGNQKFYVYAAYNVLGGANTVTITYGATTSIRPILILEVGGTAATPLDGSNKNDQTAPGTGAGAVVTGTASNTAQPALALGFSIPIFVNSPPTAVGPYTSQGNFWSQGTCESLVLSGTGSQQATFTATSGSTEHLSLLIILNHI